MIGKIFTSYVPFFDIKAKKHSLKSRPVLIIAAERNNDYTILPISSVSKRQYLDADFDIELDPEQYSQLNLTKLCYVRAHKQMPMHKSSIGKEISDLKALYPELFLLILKKLEEWNRLLSTNALN